MKTSQTGINLIKQFEGCKLVAYRCPAGVLTIGYGDTNNVHEGMVITEEEAENRLRDSLESRESFLNRLELDINQNQFDALISFIYNLGSGNFGKSTLLKKIKNNSNDPSIRNEFMKWVKAGGKTLMGLVKRRESEGDLYFKD